MRIVEYQVCCSFCNNLAIRIYALNSLEACLGHNSAIFTISECLMVLKRLTDFEVLDNLKMLDNLNGLNVFISRCSMILKCFNGLDVFEGHRVLDKVGLLNELTVLSACHIVLVSGVFEDSDMLNALKILGGLAIFGYLDILLDGLNDFNMLVSS